MKVIMFVLFVMSITIRAFTYPEVRKVDYNPKTHPMLYFTYEVRKEAADNSQVYADRTCKEAAQGIAQAYSDSKALVSWTHPSQSKDSRNNLIDLNKTKTVEETHAVLLAASVFENYFWNVFNSLQENVRFSTHALPSYGKLVTIECRVFVD